MLDKATMDRDLEHYVPAGLDPTDPRISPLRALDFDGLPPAPIHTAEFDPLRDEGKAYADRLEHAGIKVRYICHEGMIHHFYGMAGVIAYARTAMVAAFVPRTKFTVEAGSRLSWLLIVSVLPPRVMPGLALSALVFFSEAGLL